MKNGYAVALVLMTLLLFSQFFVACSAAPVYPRWPDKPEDFGVNCPDGTVESEREHLGRKEVICRMENHWPHGPVVGVKIDDGTVFLGEYENGEREGSWYIFGAGQDPDYYYEYRDGRTLASWKYYEAPDEPAKVMRFNDAGADGAWINWYRNGQKRHERHYTDGRATGVWRQWNEDGDLLNETNFDAASPDEIVEYKWLRPDGSVRIEGAYRDGLPVGTWTWWDESGEVILQECEVEGWELGECWMEKKEYPLPM